MIRPKHNAIALMNYLVCKLLNPGQLVPDPFTGTLLSCQVCLRVEKHLRLIECDKHVSCLEKSARTLIEPYTSQLLNRTSNLTTEESVHRRRMFTWRNQKAEGVEVLWTAKCFSRTNMYPGVSGARTVLLLRSTQCLLTVKHVSIHAIHDVV